MRTLAQAFGDTLRRAGMDPHTGMLPAQPCQVCGKPLDADGGHPAELYAGTFTGLCYACQNAPAFVVKTYPDGGKLWSHPPHCPAWRRDRAEFVGYDGCEKCKGRGRVMVYRCHSQGGPCPISCEDCFKRHLGEDSNQEQTGLTF